MIEFRDVHKTYVSKRDTDVDALKGVSFKIESGEFVFIIGRSGSGKSTLMKCITREEVPEEGEVLIDGFDIASMPRALIPVLRRQIGMIYQDFRLIESKTVSENIAFAGEIVGIPRKNLDRTVQLVLNVVGLKDKADSYPQELSGGEQQRVAIARAMVNTPKIVVADEPTGDLDPETSETIMALLLDINKSGSTVIVCTHDSNLVDRMKMRVIELREGKIIRDKKDSGYEDIPEEEPVASLETLNVAFGDDPAFKEDADYSDSFDDEEYNKPAEEGSFLMFGDDPELAKKAAEAAEAAKEKDSFEEEPVPAAEVPVEDTVKEAEAVEEPALEEKPVPSDEVPIEETSIDELPVEDIITEEESALSEEAKPAEAPEEIPYVPWTEELEGIDLTDEAAPEEPVKAEEQKAAETVKEEIPQAPSEEAKEVPAVQEPAPSEEKLPAASEDEVPVIDVTFGDEVKKPEKAEEAAAEETKEEKDEGKSKPASGNTFDDFLDLDIQEDDN